MSARQRIVIIGFGDTGLLVAAHLKKRYEIIAISPKPLMVSGQELGTRLARPQFWQDLYMLGFDRYKALQGVEIVHGKALSLNLADQLVISELSDGTMREDPYDALVIATGTQNGFWRTPHIETREQIEKAIAHQAKLCRTADSVAIIGGGPSGVSAAANLKQAYADKKIDLYFSQSEVLPDYHPNTRAQIMAELAALDVGLHAHHRAKRPARMNHLALTQGQVDFETGQAKIQADLVLWTIGARKPNSQFVPPALLTPDGFVRTDAHLQVPDTTGVFVIGDIADTDPNRSSARNAGFLILAKNIQAYLAKKPHKMKKFTAPRHRWGSVLGVQKTGMSIYSPQGKRFHLSQWWTLRLLFPIFVWRLIYRGVSKVKRH